MKNILKICLIAVLTLSMILCIVACGPDEEPDEGKTTTGKTTTAAVTTAGQGGDTVTTAGGGDDVVTTLPSVDQVTDGGNYGDFNPIG